MAYGTSNLDLRAEPRCALVLQSTDTLKQGGLHQPNRLGRLPESITLEWIHCYAALPSWRQGINGLVFTQSRPTAADIAAQHFKGQRPVTETVSGEPRLAPHQLGVQEERSGRAWISICWLIPHSFSASLTA